jgi:hypothetical protein
MVHPHQRCFQEYSLLLVAYCGRFLQGQYQESQRTHVSIYQKKNMAEPDLLIKNTQRKGHGTEEMPAD